MSTLRAALPSGVVARQAEPLARHTPLRTGGACAWYLVVHEVSALKELFEVLKEHELSWSVLGAGTRRVYRDGEVSGAVIRLGTELSRLDTDGSSWTIGAAVPAAALAWAAAEAGRAGVEALAGVPGSLGGALANDEGGWRDCIEEVATYRRGGVRWRSADKALGDKLILGARFALPSEEVRVVRTRTVRALREVSAASSWYEPPKKGSAEAELRRVQVAGVRLRGVLIPESAPTVLVNPGRGPARDLKLLHTSALKRVKQLRGVELTSAVQWTGRRSG